MNRLYCSILTLVLKKAEPDDPEKQDDLEYDLGNLCASDTHALNSKVCR